MLCGARDSFPQDEAGVCNTPLQTANGTVRIAIAETTKADSYICLAEVLYVGKLFLFFLGLFGKVFHEF